MRRGDNACLLHRQAGTKTCCACPDKATVHLIMRSAKYLLVALATDFCSGSRLSVDSLSTIVTPLFCTQARFEGCYVHVMSVLKVLINPGSAEGPDVASGLSTEDRVQSKSVLLHVRSLYTFTIS